MTDPSPPCRHPSWAATGDDVMFRLHSRPLPPGVDPTRVMSPPYELTFTRPDVLTCTACGVTLLQALCPHPDWRNPGPRYRDTPDGGQALVIPDTRKAECVECGIVFDRVGPGLRTI